MNVVAINSNVGALTPRQLDTIKRTIAADTNHDEFELFVEVCRRTGLDPFRKHIFPLVFSKSEATKRRMSIVVAQDGLRVLAARTRDYRPDEDEPAYEIDETLKGSVNPVGIVKASVRLWKMDRRDVWHPVKGVAWWDEFAPVKNEAEAYEWQDTGEVWEDTGRAKKKKVPKGAVMPTLDKDGQWPKRPRLMIAKCATMQALRAGWPDTYAGLYDEAEMDRARAEDKSAAEAIEEFHQERRTAAAGIKNDEYPCIGEEGNLLFIPAGRFVDHMLAAVREFKSPEQVDLMASRNREAMTRFWATHKDDALQLRDALDKRRAQLAAQPAITAQSSAAQQSTVTADTATTEPEGEAAPPLDSKARFIAECRRRIAAFIIEAKLTGWWTSVEFGQQCRDFELTQAEIDDLKNCAMKRRDEIRADNLRAG